MATQTKRVTADELWEQQGEGDKHTELIEGVIYEMPPTGFLHGDIASEINMHLRAFVKQHKLGRVTAAETGFRLDDMTVIAPDCAFV
ncbi:MAG: Uma2 family endonuclease, partial [Chloroflexota bacterium]